MCPRQQDEHGAEGDSISYHDRVESREQQAHILHWQASSKSSQWLDFMLLLHAGIGLGSQDGSGLRVNERSSVSKSATRSTSLDSKPQMQPLSPQPNKYKKPT